jgi:hypothetical protein
MHQAETQTEKHHIWLFWPRQDESMINLWTWLDSMRSERLWTWELKWITAIARWFERLYFRHNLRAKLTICTCLNPELVASIWDLLWPSIASQIGNGTNEWREIDIFDLRSNDSGGPSGAYEVQACCPDGSDVHRVFRNLLDHRPNRFNSHALKGG